MGRRKIDIQPIAQERNRAVTFAKRKSGLFKKAYELGVLCSVDVAVIIFEDKPGHDTKLHQYSSVDIRDIVQRQLRYQGENDLRGPLDFSGASNVKDNEDEDGDEEYIRIDGDESDEKPVSHPDLPALKASGGSNAKGKRRKNGEKAKLPRDDDMDLQESNSNPYSSSSYPHSHSQAQSPPPMHSSSSVGAGIGGLVNGLSTSNGISSHLPVSNDRSSSVHLRPAKRQRSTLDSMDPGRRSPATVRLTSNVGLSGSGLGHGVARHSGRVLPVPGQGHANFNSILPTHSRTYYNQELAGMYQRQGPYASLFPQPSSSSPPAFIPLHTEFGPGLGSGSGSKRAGTAARSSFATDIGSLPDIRSPTETRSGGSGRYGPLPFQVYAPYQPNSGSVASGGPASSSYVPIPRKEKEDTFSAFLEADERSRRQSQSQSHDLEQPGGVRDGGAEARKPGLGLDWPTFKGNRPPSPPRGLSRVSSTMSESSSGVNAAPPMPHDLNDTGSWFDIFSRSNSGLPNTSSSWERGVSPPNATDIQAIFGVSGSGSIIRDVKPRSGGSDRGEAETSRQGGFGAVAGSGKRGGRGTGTRNRKEKVKKTPVRVLELKRDDVDMGVPALGIEGEEEKRADMGNTDEGGARTPDRNWSAQVGGGED